jgi:hypothetical protein
MVFGLFIPGATLFECAICRCKVPDHAFVAHRLLHPTCDLCDKGFISEMSLVIHKATNLCKKDMVKRATKRKSVKTNFESESPSTSTPPLLPGLLPHISSTSTFPTASSRSDWVLSDIYASDDDVEDEVIMEPSLQPNTRNIQSNSEALQEDPLQNGEDALQEDALQEDALQEDTLQEDTLQEDPLHEDPLQEDPLQEDQLSKILDSCKSSVLGEITDTPSGNEMSDISDGSPVSSELVGQRKCTSQRRWVPESDG